MSQTKLSKDEVARIMNIVKGYLQEHLSISNRILRKLTGIGYDQAIFFFNRMIEEGKLEKSGSGSATKYTLPK